MKTRLKYLPRTIFPVYIAIAFSEKDYRHEMKRLNIKDVDVPPYVTRCAAATRLQHFRENTETYIICCPSELMKRLHKNAFVALLTHEVVHVTDWIFEYIQEKHIGMETRAYLTQFILQNCLYICDDMKKKGKKK